MMKSGRMILKGTRTTWNRSLLMKNKGMTIQELPAERVKLPLNQIRKSFVYKLHPPGRLGFVYAGITHGIMHVSGGIFAWGEKRVEKKALKVTKSIMRRWRLNEAYVEFWLWPDAEKPYRVVKVELC